MHDSLKNIRFSIKALKSQGVRPVELARSIKVHPLTYQELPYDPEYSNYAGRLTLEKLNNATPDEMYWNCLLYTSPSPRDLSTSRMPSSA